MYYNVASCLCHVVTCLYMVTLDLSGSSRSTLRLQGTSPQHQGMIDRLSQSRTFPTNAKAGIYWILR